MDVYVSGTSVSSGFQKLRIKVGENINSPSSWSYILADKLNAETLWQDCVPAKPTDIGIDDAQRFVSSYTGKKLLVINEYSPPDCFNLGYTAGKSGKTYRTMHYHGGMSYTPVFVEDTDNFGERVVAIGIPDRDSDVTPEAFSYVNFRERLRSLRQQYKLSPLYDDCAMSLNIAQNREFMENYDNVFYVGLWTFRSCLYTEMNVKLKSPDLYNRAYSKNFINNMSPGSVLDEQYMTDMYHPSPDGHRHLADRIYSELLKFKDYDKYWIIGK